MKKFSLAARFGVALAPLLFASVVSSSARAASLPMLHASGTSIVDSSNKPVLLQGVNLGSYLLMEPWMCPMDSSGNLPDNYSALSTLDNRFGVATEQSLISTYQQNWITSSDLANIKKQGLNCVRVPVWWGDFYTLSGAWRSDAFTRLDWLVSNCASNGIYVIIDMHGVFGGQADNQDTGEQGENDYWSNTADQNDTASMMSLIAAHYAGNTAVAGYDLLNEPTGTPNNQTYWTLVNGLYNAVRSNDPGHICIVEADDISGTWNTIPMPSTYNWTDVVYEMHEYEFNGTDKQIQSGSQNQVYDFQTAASENVPVYIGEFNDFQYTDAWQYTIPLWNSNNLSWTTWAYKATHGSGSDSWGLYDVNSSAPPVPNLTSDSAATISAAWTKWTTASAFTLNPTLSPIIIGNRTDILPSQPASLSATPGYSDARLTWSPTIGATTYDLYRATKSGAEGSTPVVAGIAGTTYIDTGLTNGATYYFRVAAKNATGIGPKSAEISKAPSASDGPIPNGAYTLTPQNATGARIDAPSGTTTSGTQIQIYAAGAGNPNQKWVLINKDNGYYTIEPSYDASLALGVPTGPKPGNGTPVELLANTGGSSQNWILAAAPGGYSLSPASAPGYTMNITGDSAANGTLIELYQASGGGANATFAFSPS